MPLRESERGLSGRAGVGAGGWGGRGSPGWGRDRGWEGSVKPEMAEGDRARARRVGPRVRLWHLMYAGVVVALFCWVGIVLGLPVLAISFAVLATTVVVGCLVVLVQGRSSRREALLGVLALAAREDL